MSMTPERKQPRSIPLIKIPQYLPSKVCLCCDICCRFPDEDSFLRPYFTREEIKQAVTLGIDHSAFADPSGSQIRVVPNPRGEGYLCPAFDPETFHCRIYAQRPLDCQIYPFTLMWNEDRTAVGLGWDRKCPFMMNDAVQSSESHSLLPEVQQYASTIQQLLETDQVVEVVVKNSRLITPFQEDVVMVHALPQLTKRLIGSP